MFWYCMYGKIFKSIQTFHQPFVKLTNERVWLCSCLFHMWSHSICDHTYTCDHICYVNGGAVECGTRFSNFWWKVLVFKLCFKIPVHIVTGAHCYALCSWVSDCSQHKRADWLLCKLCIWLAIIFFVLVFHSKSCYIGHQAWHELALILQTKESSTSVIARCPLFKL